jgi:hypothetical protein
VAEITPVNVIQGLSPAFFRGLEFPPYDDVTFDFSHAQAAHAFPFLNGAMHEAMGLNPHELKFKLYFLNTLGAGTDVFPGLWNDWWVELQDGSPGELEHPLLGPRMVVVQGGSVQLSARVTSGIIVDVTFSTTVVDPEKQEQNQAIAVGVKELAAAADAAAAEADIPYPDGMLEPSLFDLLKQIDGLIFSFELSVLGVITQAQAAVDSMVDFVERNDERLSATFARDALVKLWGSLEDLKDTVGSKLRPQGCLLTAQPTTLEAFAADRGNTLGDIIELNPGAVAAPSIPPGVLLRYYL